MTQIGGASFTEVGMSVEGPMLSPTLSEVVAADLVSEDYDRFCPEYLAWLERHRAVA